MFGGKLMLGHQKIWLAPLVLLTQVSLVRFQFLIPKQFLEPIKWHGPVTVAFSLKSY